MRVQFVWRLSRAPGADPRAFAPTKIGRARVQRARAADLVQRALHVPRKSAPGAREGGEGPPVVVAVAGPAGVGKSTLVRSLARHYTKQSLAQAVGPAPWKV